MFGWIEKRIEMGFLKLTVHDFFASFSVSKRNQQLIFEPMAIVSIPKYINGSDLNIGPTNSKNFYIMIHYFYKYFKIQKGLTVEFLYVATLSISKSLYGSYYSLWPHN